MRVRVVGLPQQFRAGFNPIRFVAIRTHAQGFLHHIRRFPASALRFQQIREPQPRVGQARRLRDGAAIPRFRERGMAELLMRVADQRGKLRRVGILCRREEFFQPLTKFAPVAEEFA